MPGVGGRGPALQPDPNLECCWHHSQDLTLNLRVAVSAWAEDDREIWVVQILIFDDIKTKIDHVDKVKQ